MSGTQPVADEAPHAVRPGESCIFCAEKHLSTAYVEFNSEHSTGAVVGEMVIGGHGLGTLLTGAQNSADTTGMFATIIVLALAAMSIYWLLTIAERKAARNN